MNYKQQVFMAPSGFIGVITPLFPIFEDEALDQIEGVRINLQLTPVEPLAFIVEYDNELEPQVFSNRIIKHLEILGDL